MLILHALPEPVNKDIINPPTFPIHTDLHPMPFEHRREGLTGVLSALVRVENLWNSITPKGFLQGFPADLSVQCIRDAPSQHASRIPVHLPKAEISRIFLNIVEI